MVLFDIRFSHDGRVYTTKEKMKMVGEQLRRLGGSENCLRKIPFVFGFNWCLQFEFYINNAMAFTKLQRSLNFIQGARLDLVLAFNAAKLFKVTSKDGASQPSILAPKQCSSLSCRIWDCTLQEGEPLRKVEVGRTPEKKNQRHQLF